jgi:hypothetical protein
MYRSVIKNFNPSATVNDGSCTYRSAKVSEIFDTVTPARHLSLVLNDNLFWTTNDDTDTTIYGTVDTTGVIQKSSKKWSTKRLEISQDNTIILEISAIMFPETERPPYFKNRKSLALDVPR